MEYFLYILYSEKIDRYYIGISRDPFKRLKSHNLFHKGWTKRGIPWKLVYSYKFENKKQALYWEQFIKKQKSRKLILKIINQQFSFYK